MSHDMLAQMEEDSAPQLPKEEKLKKLSLLAQRQLDLEAEIAELEEKVTLKNADLKKVAEIDIPELFQELGLSEFKLLDGSKVEVKPYYAGNISENNKVPAFKWLRDNDHDDLIKHEIKVGFGKGEDEAAAQLRRRLTELNVNFTDTESVHHSTLKAFIREQVETLQTPNFPLTLFNVYIGNKTKITLPRKKK